MLSRTDLADTVINSLPIGWDFNEVIVNMMEMWMVWIMAAGFMAFFLFMRMLCVKVHYWGWHWKDLEQSFRFQLFIRGF